MTNEQAIKILTEAGFGINIWNTPTGYCEEDWDEALDMAIEALTHFNSIKKELEKMMDELEITADNRHLNDYEYGWNQALYHLLDKIDDWSFESSCSEKPNESEPKTAKDAEQRQVFWRDQNREP